MPELKTNPLPIASLSVAFCVHSQSEPRIVTTTLPLVMFRQVALDSGKCSPQELMFGCKWMFQLAIVSHTLLVERG